MQYIKCKELPINYFPQVSQSFSQEKNKYFRVFCGCSYSWHQKTKKEHYEVCEVKESY